MSENDKRNKKKSPRRGIQLHINPDKLLESKMPKVNKTTFLKPIRQLFTLFGITLPNWVGVKFIVNAVVRRLQEKRLKPYQAELIRMQKYLEEAGRGMIIIFEGRDAAGKGGTIRRVSRYMNEKHYRVVALGKPTEQQTTQFYFQRYTEQLPRAGEVVLFDRSWYNRAMVEPILEFCTDDEYKTFMEDVSQFEEMLTRKGIIIVKLYFSVTKEEQAKRFKRRETDPLRQWKLSEVDMQAQERWGEFTIKKYKMLLASHSFFAKWTIIRSNDKFKARLNAMRVILNSVPYKKLDPKKLCYVPNHNIVVSGAHEIEIMEADELRGGDFIE